MATLNMSRSHVLITGGSSGIGCGLAERFHAAGATVLVTGRSAENLDRMTRKWTGLRTFAGDIGQAEDREALAAHVRQTMSNINILINNAGIQRRVGLADDRAAWSERQAEIDILLSGPIHLNHLLIPVMLAHGSPSLIVNVTSGGAFVPQPFSPIYSACKAALHSYTVNLRFALADSAISVKELIPPAVATGLAGADAAHGAPLETYCDAVFTQLVSGQHDEVGFGMTASDAFVAAQAPYKALFAELSGRFPIRTYAQAHDV